MSLQFNWTKQYEFSGVEWATGLVQLPGGDFYFTGFSKNSTAEQPFQTDLIRTDQAGTIVWSRTLMDGYTMAYGAALSGDGGLYIGGHCNGGSLGEANPGPSGHFDNFLQKYNAYGDLQWTTIIGTDTIDQGMALSASPSGQIYFAGYTYGNLAGDNAGSSDIILSSINPDGVIQWHLQFGGSGADISMASSLAGDGSIYVAGYTNGNIDDQLNQGADDGFITRLDSDGNRLWTRLIGYSGIDHIYGIFAASDGSVYATGRQEKISDSADVFLTKYTSTGDHLWTQFLGSDGYEYGRSISETLDGKILLTGRTDGNFEGQISHGGFDAFVALFDASGNKLVSSLIGTAYDDAGNIILQGVNGSYYLAGMSGGDLNGQTNADPGTYDALLTSFTIPPLAQPSATLSLLGAIDSLAESTDTSKPYKVADIHVDDGLVSYAYSLSGADAIYFEITGQSIYLRKNLFLSYDSGKISYEFTVNAFHPTDPSLAPLTINHTIKLINTPPSAPTVDTLFSSLPRPTISGSVYLETGASFTVSVNNRTYGFTDGLKLFGNRWELALSEDLANGSYDIVAAHTDASGDLSTVDTTSNELLINAATPKREVDVILLDSGSEDSGSSGSASALPTRFLVSRSSADSATLAIYYTIEGSAKPGIDYALPSDYDLLGRIGSILIASDQSSTTVVLPTLNNLIHDGVRTLGIRLLPDDSYLLKQESYASSVNLVDDDPEPVAVIPVVSIEGQSFSEGSDGLWRVRSVKISLSDAPAQSLSVDLCVRNVAPNLGGATRDVDFQVADQRITFAPGVTSIMVDISIFGDTTQEDNSEAFELFLVNPTIGLLLSDSNASARIVIADDDLGKVIDLSADPVGNPDIKGSDFADLITGTNYADVIEAGPGSDWVRGFGGPDSIILGTGADTIVYGGFGESSLSNCFDNVDKIYDFNRLEGDRFKLNSTPTRLWSAASSNQINPLLAAQALFLDRNPVQSELQALGSREAILFSIGSGRRQRFFIAVNNEVAGFQPLGDLLVDVTGPTVRLDSAYRQPGIELNVGDFFLAA